MKKIPFRCSALALACAALFTSAAQAGAPSYQVTWLGFLDAADNQSFATAINASGQVVGSSGLFHDTNSYNDRSRGFVWSQQSGLTNLGQYTVCATQPCYTQDASGNTWNDYVNPAAISDSGTIVGMADGPGGYEHSFLYTAALGMTAPLGLPIGFDSHAAGINRLNEVVGYKTGTFNGTFWSEVGYVLKPDGSLTILPPVAGADVNYPYKINDAGQAVGGASYRLPPDGINPPGTITFSYRPAIWEKDASGQYAGRFLPGFDAIAWSLALDVNAAGQIAGYMQLPDNYHAFLYSNGAINDLGCGMAQGINAAGTVVGGGAAGFIYYQGQRYDLDALVANKAPTDTIAYANAINDAGWIVGSGLHDGKTEAFVLIPDGTDSAAPPAVPCPGTTPPPPPPPQGADLNVTMTDAPDPVTVGATLTYTIIVANNGNASATGVTLADALPAGVAFISASASQGSCAGGLSLSCGLGDIAPGAAATIQVAVQPSASGSLSNTASVSAAAPDLNPADDSATAVTTVNAPVSSSGSADLAVSVVDEPDPATVGGELTYVVKIKNKSASAAAGVSLAVQLPASARLYEVAGATCAGTGTVTCNVGSIAAKGSKEVDITMIPLAAGTLKGSATVTSATTDPVTSNNTAKVSTTVQ